MALANCKQLDHRCTAEMLPVTALSFVDCNGRELLFAGEGCKVKVFEPRTKACSRAWQVLPHSCTIHGIRHRPCVSSEGWEHECCVLVFGQKKLRVVKCSSCNLLTASSIQLVMLSDAQELGDWILEAQWLDGVETTIAMVMAHNCVTLWNWQKGHAELVVHSEVNCILYSSRLRGNKPDDVIVASGTVFNAVLLWKLNGAKDEHTKRTKVNLSLKGHAGVIFGVRFSADMRRVCSVSDDRTVRVWTLPPKWLLSYNQSLEQADLVFYGHSARVWSGFLLKDCIISAGEDVTCRVWSYQGECQDVIEGHKNQSPDYPMQGRNIWSMAVNGDESLLATGGGDCSIRLTPINRQRKHRGTVFQLTVTGGADSEGRSCSDFVRSVRLLSENTALCLSNKGQLHSLSVDGTSRTFQWDLLWSDIHFSSYSIMDVSPCSHFVAIGNLTGEVKLTKLHHSKTGVCVDDETTRVFTAHSGKVFSLHFASVFSRLMLITCGPDGIIMLWEVGSESDERVLPPVLPLVCCLLPLCKHRWPTAALLSPLPSHPTNFALVCGDRSGSLHSYPLVEMRGARGVPIAPTTTLRGVHGHHGVSSLTHHNVHIFSTGREGHYRQLALGEDGCLYELAKHKVFKGFDWLEQLVFLRHELLVVGFHSAELVMHNVTTGKTVRRVTCGGAHRSWDFAISTKAVDQQGFVYLKGSEIHFHLFNLQLESQQTVLQASYHGREANCVTVVKEGSKGSVYLATGSEDCAIQIIECNSVSACLTTVETADRHNSSVRAVSTDISQLTGKTLLFSGGGRASMKAWEFQEGGSHGNHSTPKLVLQTEMTLHLLSERQRRKLRRHAHPCTPPPPDCRIMALTSFSISEIEEFSSSNSLHCVVAACSDSVLRVYVYDEVCKRFHLVGEMDHQPWCLFAVHHIVIPSAALRCQPGCSAETATAFIFVGSAEGSVSVWDTTALLREWIAENAAHSRQVGREQNEIATTSQRGLTEATSLEEMLTTLPCQTTTTAGAMTEPPVCQSVPLTTPDVSLPSVPLQEEGSEAMVSQLARHLESSTVSGGRTGERDTTQSGNEGTAIASLHLDAVSNDEPAAGMRKKTNGKGEEGDKREDGGGGGGGRGGCGVKLSPPLVLSVHQSGVNAVDVTLVDAKQYLYMVLSGGDDTAITASLCRLHPQDVGMVTRATYPSAHYSAITGVSLLDCSTAVTASVDQKVSLWRLSLTRHAGVSYDLHITHTRSVMTDVSDVSSLCVVPKRCEEDESKIATVAVAGVGVQCVNMDI